MKAKKLREMNDAELMKKLEELKKELLRLKTQIASKTVPENPGKIRSIKKTIARIYTIRRERKKE